MSCNSNYSTDSFVNIPYRTALLPTKQDSKMAQTCFRQDHKTANDRYQWTQRQKVAVAVVHGHNYQKGVTAPQDCTLMDQM